VKARDPWRIFVSVLRALFLRELNMRITVGKSGLFWTFFEPFFQTFVFILIHIAITGQSSAGNTPYNYNVFLASGFIAYNIFRNILMNGAGSFIANKNLFIYKQVKPIDTLFSRTLVALFINLIVIFIFILIGFFTHQDNLMPKNPLMVMVAYIWFTIFSFGISLIVATGSVFYISISKFMGIASFALLMVSGIFYSVSSLPPSVQTIILYNPLVHFMEMIHGYYIYGLDDRYVDYRYLVLWTVLPLFIGFWLYERLEKRIISE
jgi:capsular polysaccharide transport system permease protein